MLKDAFKLKKFETSLFKPFILSKSTIVISFNQVNVLTRIKGKFVR